MRELMPDEAAFESYCRRIEHYLYSKYGIPIIVRDIPDPLTGDLDGREIHVDYALNWEQRLFLILHLFGHTVQWNLNVQAREIGQPRQVPVPEECLPAISNYEREAGEYALWLLHQAGIHDLDQWLSDFTAADMAFLIHYYRTGEKKEFKLYLKAGNPLLQPSPVPEFRPQKWVSRLEGIVL
jgi:hypothetical protein